MYPHISFKFKEGVGYLLLLGKGYRYALKEVSTDRSIESISSVWTRLNPKFITTIDGKLASYIYNGNWIHYGKDTNEADLFISQLQEKFRWL